MGVLEKIAAIQEEMARTQKNKATEYHLGLLKGKLAKLRRELLEPQPGQGGGGGGQGFEIAKAGDARVSLIGFPSVGKSSFLSNVTNTKSEAASYEFTTLTSVGGLLQYNGAEIQIVDLPGIIKAASQGKGRGRQVIAVARTSDLIMMVLDATKGDDQKEILENELESMGIRLNKEKPDISLKLKKTGGVKLNSINPPVHLNEKIVAALLKEYKIHSADVLIRDENVTIDDFIDIINEQHVTYIKCLYVYNKVDVVSLEECDRLARLPNTVVMSCELTLGIEDLKEEIWRQLGLIRLYTKRRGIEPDFSDPMVVRNNSTIQSVCDAIHRDMKNQFKFALVWGSSSKHSPQRCGLNHIIHDEDVVQIVTK
ncbi:ribosome-interacting GTPase 2 [[Candida] jaroonii]|uniref:Ribosome-interacting GTPase 2 n=1 Tax=[Candida] jaroonii TaxID=467808 RepID=A0ACA9YB03_9ASCO|nr:ribosome-interacting GTPase 2 [[Candida] jaroonii]